MKNYIKGNYRKSIFKSDQGYTIGLFKIRDSSEELKEFINKTITFTGYFHDLNEDDIYIFYGNLVDNPKYGLQFQVDDYERLTPNDEEGIITFLSSDLFKGVGETMARNIVDTLGNDALNLIIADFNCLLDVPKMTFKKASLIHQTLVKYENSHQMIVYLTDLGFNMKDSLSIYNFYKDNTIMKIEHNIYDLIDDINTLSFLKIDEISFKLNIDKTDDRRIKAVILYVMKNIIYTSSDTYLLLDEIHNGLVKYLKFEVNNLDTLLDELIDEDKIIKEGEFYYLNEIHEAEKTIIDTIYYLTNKPISECKNIEKQIKNQEKINNIKYNDDQKKAITKSLQNNITIITGGPGTGKTTIIKAICDIYMEMNKLNFETAYQTIALLAPTGRASKRLAESTLLNASTIHRFLKWNKENNEFMVNENSPNFHTLVIVDETSMIDINLLSSLFKGLTPNIKLVLVGDYNQLPSVGPGQVLKDLIESDMIDTLYLKQLYRASSDSYITSLASEIKDGTISDSFLETKSDYTFLECSSNSLKENLKKVSFQLIEKGYNLKQFQIIAPMYAGTNGIDALNKELQIIFNNESDDKKQYVYGDLVYREKDKVIQLVNMPEENIFNGDIGIIEKIVKIENKYEIYIDFDGNLVRFLPKDLNKIKHGYVISIHKSQGSEFDTVIMPICDSYKRMLYRKLIYTAITRAKRKLILIGQANSFLYSINNNNEKVRKTLLKDKLMNKIINK